MSDGVRRLAAQLLTPVSADQIWAVLTDYDQLSAFIPNLASSRLLLREGNKVHLAARGMSAIPRNEIFSFRGAGA